MASPVQVQPMQGGGAEPGGGMQPQLVEMTTRPPGCPPGLEYLVPLDQIHLKQEVELVEAFVGIETGNKYEVQNNLGQRIYYAKEDRCCEGCCICCGRMGCCKSCVRCWGRQCCRDRSTSLTITDNLGHKVMWLDRPMRCTSCFCPCCLQVMRVFDAEENALGSVAQTWGICKPTYAIRDANGDTVLKIKGPICTTSCCMNDVSFKLLTPEGEKEVGKVAKKWSGIGKEAFTDADNFGISFPIDLDVKIKSVVLAAAFLIDLMFFEESTVDKRKDLPGMVG